MNVRAKELWGIDIRALALFRIFISAILLIDLLIRASDLEAFYTDFGVLPRNVLLEKFSDPWYFSFHLIGGALLFQSVLFLIHGLFGTMLLVGYRTKLANVVCWILTVSLHVRNPMILQGGDSYLRMLLFWGMFLPLGAAYSVDRVFSPLSSKVPQVVLSAGSVAILFQILFVYYFSSLYKTGPEWTEDGSALYLALGITQYQKPLGWFLLQFPRLLSYLTVVVVWIERAGFFFFFSPFWTGPVRTATVLVFFFFHLGIWLCLDIGIFPWVCFCGIILFLPSWFWDRNEPVLEMFLDSYAKFIPRGINQFTEKCFGFLKTLLSGADKRKLESRGKETIYSLPSKNKPVVIVSQKGLARALVEKVHNFSFSLITTFVNAGPKL